MVASDRDDDTFDRVKAVVSAVLMIALIAAFVILFGFPRNTRQLWAWRVEPTMTAMMMGAGYLGGAWFFGRVIRSRQGYRAIPGLLAATIFATLLLIATILHWDKFNHGHVSFWAWLFLYVAAPVWLPVLWVAYRRKDIGTPQQGEAVVPNPLRWSISVIGLAGLLGALILFVHPALGVRYWPWPLTLLTARTAAAFIAFPAMTLLLFATDRRWGSFQFPLEGVTIGLALLLIASLRGAAEFDSASSLYRVVLSVSLAALVSLQIMMARQSWRIGPVRRSTHAQPTSAPEASGDPP